MMIYRDRRKEELKEFEKQVEEFEIKMSNPETCATISSIMIENSWLEDTTEIQNKFREFQEELFYIWSTVSSMTEDMKRFHTKLKIMESINSTEDDKYEARQFLRDYKTHESRIEGYKFLKPQMDDHNRKIEEFTNEYKSIQLKNAKTIIKIIESIFTRSGNNITSNVLKLQQHCDILEDKFSHLLKPCQIPALHEMIKKEFARRYRFEHLQKIKINFVLLQWQY